MKAFQLLTLFSFFMALFSTILADASTYTSLCRLFKNKTKFRVPGSCDQYIECDGLNGQVFSCGTNLQFDKETGKCIKDLDISHLCENRCKNEKDDKFMANPIDCRGYYYCKNKQAIASTCDIKYYFDEKRQLCVYPSNSICIQDIVNNVCELVKDGTVFRDENNCLKYYKCTKNQQTSIECKDKYFNVETGQCDNKTNVPCDNHPSTSTTCLNGEKILRGKIPDGFTCRGYFYCADKGEHAHDLQPVWLQCPVGQFFNGKNCEDQWEVKCKYDRCDGHGNTLSTSEKNNCRNYLVCKDDRTVEEKACKVDYFFDEKLQDCVEDIIYYKSCDQPETHS